jgi:hypothetical protein
MILYKVFYKNYHLKKGELIGTLVERRIYLRGKTSFETGSKWAKLTFGRVLKDKHAIFVVPEEFNLETGTSWLVEERVFNE